MSGNGDGNERFRHENADQQQHYESISYADAYEALRRGEGTVAYDAPQQSQLESRSKRHKSRDSNERRSRRRRRSPSYSDRRSRSRSKSRSRSRSYRRSNRSQSRSRSRSRSYDRRYSRSRSRSRSYDDADDYRRRDGGRRSKRYEAMPNQTMILKGLPTYCDENLVWEIIGKQGFIPKDVRVVRSRDTGQTRGFGFVEFTDVNEAIRWMQCTQGRVQLDEHCVADLEYSFNKYAPGVSPSPALVIAGMNSELRGGDWTCAKCNTNNFKKREVCFKCNIRREESEALASDGFNEIGVMPCDTLLLRNLPLTADESRITVCLTKLTSLDIRRIVLARNVETRVSRGFAYVEMSNLTEAAQLLTTLTAVTKLNIDGKEVFVSYSKHPLEAVLSGANLAADSNQTLPLSSNSNFAKAASVANVIPTDVTNAAAAVAQNAIKKAQVLRQVAAAHMPNIHVPPPPIPGTITTAATLMPVITPVGSVLLATATDSAASLFQQQAALAAAHTLQELTAARILQESAAAVNAFVSSVPPLSLGTVHTPHGELPRYPEPDVTTYQYESSSGFYYDSTTGLYYDAKTQYYYNADTQQYLYWDPGYKTFLPTPSADSAQAVAISNLEAPSASNAKTDSDKKLKEHDKVKMAKKIQKDMEKWAKQCEKNQKKDKATGAVSVLLQPAASTSVQHSQQAEVDMRHSATADAAFSVLEKTARLSSAGLVSYDAGDSDDEVTSGALADSSLARSSSSSALQAASLSPDIDFDKLACLLCRRQFPSREVLIKHEQLSDLHKKNLEAKNRTRLATNQMYSLVEERSAAGSQYRDRAKERRQKFGDDDRPVENRLKQKYLNAIEESAPEEPNTHGIRPDNVGNKLLKSMGWQEGQGLGRQNQGIIDPITQKKRSQGAGLGAGSSGVDTAYTTSYKDQLRAVLRQKFNDA